MYREKGIGSIPLLYVKILFNFSFFVFKAKENICRNSQFERSIWKI